MKINKFIALFFVFALVPAVSIAAEIRGGNQPAVGNSETINNDLYIAGGSVSSYGKIQGDLVAAGGNITVTGPVGQDIMAAGGTVTILGSVGESVRAAGGNVTVSGLVGRDVVVSGGQVQILGSRVGRDVVVAGGMVQISSPVAGNVRFVGGELYINAPISGNVDAQADKITLGSSAVISGNLIYKARKMVVMEEGARVNGTVTYTEWASKSKEAKNVFIAIFTAAVIAKFLMLMVCALVVGLVFKRYVTEIIHRASKEPMAGLGMGTVVLIVLPILSVILLITVVGVPFGVLGLIGFVGLLIVSCLVAPILLGSLIYKWAMKGAAYEVSWKTIVLGVVVYFVLGFVPFLGCIVHALFVLVTLGVIAKIKWNLVKGFR